ncbi:MAG TPA: hypothetical protein ENI27_08330, partial [bacterium]|nr:hypothetical protein [bacterium]
MTAIESAEERKRLRIAIEELQKENESEVQGLKDDKEFLTDRVRQLSNAEAEVKQLKQWVHDLQSGMYINCVYCGHRY